MAGEPPTNRPSTRNLANSPGTTGRLNRKPGPPVHSEIEALLAQTQVATLAIGNDEPLLRS